MKILFLTHRLPFAPNRGDRIRAFYLMRAMSQFADVSLFSLVHDSEEAAEVASVPFATRVRTARVARLRNLARGAFSLLTSRPLTHVLLDASDVRQSLDEMRRAHPPDLVVAFCSGMARFTAEPPLAGLPVAVDFVDVDSTKWAELAATASWPMRAVYAREARTLGRFEAHAARQANASIVCNGRERDTLAKLSPATHIDVVENGIDLDAFRPVDPPAESHTVVFCGVMDYEPNRQAVLWFAREVWPLVRARRPDARFLVVGSNPTPDVLALASDASIEVAGRVPLVQPYLWRSAVCVAPLAVARGVQNKVLEGLAAGLPAVVTSAVAAGLPEEARRGCLVADGSHAFADAVLRRLELDPTDRRRIAMSDLESLSWDRRLEPLAGILQRAAGGHGR